jgi:type IV secretion system protein VirD4
MTAAHFLRRRALPNAPYLIIFWLADKLGEAYRLAPGRDFLQKLVHSMGTMGAAMENPLPSFVLFDLAVGVAGAAVIYAVVCAKKKNAKKYRKNEEHGSARWGKPADIAPFLDGNKENNIILTQTEGLTMNPRPANPKYARNKNMLVIGGSGSGKTRFIIKPNLMQCRSKDYPVSFVITDPKGTLIEETGKMLRHHGYRIKVLNTINFKKSMHFNPLAYIHSEKDILKLVTTLIANTKSDQKGGDPFWEKAETLLYTALIAYLYYESPPEERCFSTLAEMIGAMEVREDDESFQNIVDLMFEGLAERDPEHFAVRQYRKYKLAAGVVCSNGRFNQRPLFIGSHGVCGTNERTPRNSHYAELPAGEERLWRISLIQRSAITCCRTSRCQTQRTRRQSGGTEKCGERSSKSIEQSNIAAYCTRSNCFRTCAKLT